MAYMIEMQKACDAAGCERRPTFEVRAYANEVHGHYCEKHARERVAALSHAEASNPAGFR